MKAKNALATPPRLDQQKYTGPITETPINHITFWVNDPLKRFTTTFNPKFLAAKIRKYKGLLEVSVEAAKANLTQEELQELKPYLK